MNDKAKIAALPELSDQQCREFRTHPGDFNAMLRATYRAGAQAALALTADASEQAQEQAARYELRLCAPNGNKSPWNETSAEAFIKFSSAPDVGDGFKYETRSLFERTKTTVTLKQAELLAGVQALCIAADQEWCRQEGRLSEWDQAWFKGQLHVFDMYTAVEKEAIATAREYIGKLCVAAPAAPVADTGAVDDPVQQARQRLEAQWDAQGDCGSCGWHGALYEHNVDDDDIREALKTGWLELNCVSKDADDADTHRGVKIFIGATAPATPTATADSAADARDTARLDFITKNEVSIYTFTSQQREPLTDGSRGYRTRTIVEGWLVGISDDPKATPRDAIDAAMQPTTGEAG